MTSYHYHCPPKKYGFWHCLFDFILVVLTGGLWLIWLFIRYMGRNSR